MVGLAAALAVLAAAPLKVEVTPPLVTIGSQAGVIVSPGPAPDERVTIEMKRCVDTSWSTVAGARFSPDGYWTATIVPRFNALVRARVRDTTSTSARVQVRPYVTLDVLTRPWLKVGVGAGRYLPGKRIYIERFTAGLWKRTASARLAREGSFGFALSSVRFRLRLPAGTRIRAVIPGTACYLKGVSEIERA
jgi:hypothetical protein